MKQYLTLLSYVLAFFALGTGVVFAQTLDQMIINFSLFLRNIILPFLISVAFLYFLINMVRYFIIQGASEEGRAKAKRSATYGVIAFVFLFSIWGIVSIVVTGVLGSGYEENSICPDYLDGFCGNQSNSGGPTGATFPGITPGTGGGSTGGGTVGNGTGGGGTGSSGGTTDSGSSNSGGTSGNSGSGSGNSTTPGGSAAAPAALAELIFGTGTDSASFTTYTGDPRSFFNTPAIAETTTCEAGLTTLSLASRAEDTQAAYVLYKNIAGATRWENITDLNSTNYIGYDNDTLQEVLATGAQDAYIVHTHPQSRIDAQGLIMSGHGPSAADMRAMCELNNPAVGHLTVDWTGVWEMQQQNDTCPYSLTARTVLPLLEAYNNLAALDSSQRASEITQYTDSRLVPATYSDHFSAIDPDSLGSYTPEELIALGTNYQSYASTTITYSQSIAQFCGTY